MSQAPLKARYLALLGIIELAEAWGSVNRSASVSPTLEHENTGRNMGFGYNQCTNAYSRAPHLTVYCACFFSGARAKSSSLDV